MNEAKVTPLGDGEPMAMCEETGVAQVTQRKGVEAVKAQGACSIVCVSVFLFERIDA